MPLLNDHWALVVGILGDVMSFLVYLAPLPTFYRIVKTKSTEGFQSIPYSVALFSAMLTLYYGILKNMNSIIILINSAGCVIETIYLTLYLMNATKSDRISTVKFLSLANGVCFGSILLVASLFTHGSEKVDVVGWICAVFSVCVFAAPLSIMRRVIRTRSVEFMPFLLSLALTLSAAFWLMYGLSLGDYFIATPNFLGLAFGVAQMILYLIYRNKKNEVLPESLPNQQLANAKQVHPEHVTAIHSEQADVKANYICLKYFFNTKRLDEIPGDANGGLNV